MRFVRLLYGLLAAWSVVVLVFAAVALAGAANGMSIAPIAAMALAATAIPYIIVRSLEKMSRP